MTSKIENNGDATAAIESLEALLKAKIRLQDAQAEAQPVLETVSLLFEPDPLDENQKNLLRNGLKNLKKLLEAHTAYGDALQQAEPAKAIVGQLLGSQPAPAPQNGKTDSKPAAAQEKDATPNAQEKAATSNAQEKAAASKK
jgi:hypothetical protein